MSSKLKTKKIRVFLSQEMIDLLVIYLNLLSLILLPYHNIDITQTFPKESHI